MALYIRQNEGRSRLQERLNAELQEKNKQKFQIEPKGPESVEDSAYLKDMKSTGKTNWVWIGVVLVIVLIVGFFIYQFAVK